MSDKLYNFLLKQRQLFWDIGISSFKNLSEEAIVERIMVFGDIGEYKELEDVLGINQVKKDFQKIISKKRKNLRAETENLFQLYFQNHA